MESYEETKKFLDNVIPYLSYLFDELKKQGRISYNVGICCTGGQHRSPYIANYLKNYFAKEYKTSAFHRDCKKRGE